MRLAPYRPSDSSRKMSRKRKRFDFRPYARSQKSFRSRRDRYWRPSGQQYFRSSAQPWSGPDGKSCPGWWSTFYTIWTAGHPGDNRYQPGKECQATTVWSVVEVGAVSAAGGGVVGGTKANLSAM